MLARIANIGLRGITLASKFVMIFFMALFLEPADVGLYGLLFASVSYGIYVLGFEFYTYSTREIASSPNSAWFTHLRDQVAFTLVVYTVSLPLFLMIFAYGYLPQALAGWFFILVMLEHTSQELYRLLAAMSMQLEASMVLLLKSGLWSVIVVVVMWLIPTYRDIQILFAFWSCGLVAAVLAGVYFISRVGSERPAKKISLGWIKRGIRVAIPLLVASLALRGLFSFDRFIVQQVAGVDLLGAYVFFAGIASAVMAFVDAGVVVFYFPKIVSAARAKEWKLYFNLMRAVASQIAWFAACGSLSALAFSFVLVQYLDSEIYASNFNYAYWFIGSAFIYIIGLIPHIGLFALDRDRALLGAQVAGLVLFLVGANRFSERLGVEGVLLALLCAFMAIGAIKAVYFWASIRRLTQ